MGGLGSQTAKSEMKAQEGVGRLRGRREVKTASSGWKGDERPRGRQMFQGNRNIERRQVVRKALSGQDGAEWSGSRAARRGKEQPGGA